ncbi:hypothetical protein ACWENS_05520 [Streptomyces sp. NPDC004532]
MTRRQQEENTRLREARRESLLVLLSRASRGVLSPADGALLRMHVETEMMEAEAARKTGAGAVRASHRYMQQLAAANTAIEEIEADRDAAQQLAKDLAARQDAGTVPYSSMYVRVPHWEYDLMREQRERADRAEGDVTGWRDRAETAEQRNEELHAELGLAPGQLHSAALAAIRGRGENIRELTARAEQAEQFAKRADHRAEQAEAALSRLHNDVAAKNAEAARCAVCGDPNPTYSNYREQLFCAACANCDCNQPTCVRTGFNAPAVSDQDVTEIQPTPAERLTAPPVPAAYRAPAGDPVAVLGRIRDAAQWSDVQAQLGMYYGWTAEQAGQRARAYRLDAEHRATEAEQLAEQRAVAVADAVTRAEARADDAKRANERADRAEQQVADELATGTRYANWLANTREACGAPNWPELADTVRAIVEQRNTAQAELRRSENAREQLRSDLDRTRKLRNEWARGADTEIAEYREHAKAADSRAEAAARLGVRYMADAERYRDAWRSARRRAAEHYTEQQRVRGWTGHWNERAVAAEKRAATAQQTIAAEREIHNRRRRNLAAALGAHIDTPWPQLVEHARDERARGQQLDAIRTPGPAGRDHPMHAIRDAMTGPGIPHARAITLIGQYFDAITGRTPKGTP